VQEARGSVTKALPDATLTVYPLQGNTYTQPVGRDDTYLAALEVLIPETCTGTRHIKAGLLVDPADPAEPEIGELVAVREFDDSSAEPLTARISLGPASSFQPEKPTSHALYLAAEATCTGGAGVTATSGGIDVIGTQ
jgi:hypothetical protein